MAALTPETSMSGTALSSCSHPRNCQHDCRHKCGCPSYCHGGRRHVSTRRCRFFDPKWDAVPRIKQLLVCALRARSMRAAFAASNRTARRGRLEVVVVHSRRTLVAPSLISMCKSSGEALALAARRAAPAGRRWDAVMIVLARLTCHAQVCGI